MPSGISTPKAVPTVTPSERTTLPGSPAENAQGTKPPPETQYELVAARRDASKAQVWQVPLLGVTIQAFLLTIALSQQYDVWSRLGASLLGLITALACAQLIARHRRFETADAQWLTRYERLRAEEGWLDISDRDFPLRVTSKSASPAHPLMLPRHSDLPKRRWWHPLDYSSYRVWLWILFLFAAVAFVTVLRHAAQPSLPGTMARSAPPNTPSPTPTDAGAAGTSPPTTGGR